MNKSKNISKNTVIKEDKEDVNDKSIVSKKNKIIKKDKNYVNDK